ncbi:MAG TPA: ABC transporter substrate-binding protein [Flexivirga sp.]|uniref:ABC transporter substrate-binding protein n=1 Tax=Flexivirga sp. TaxID=1962927 RepID=UPI002D09CC01|nr:ABC transporter substrate-binding protein [Flexivirga sp.]HWC23888.1 ABC transporter substrate-binding protein [Flexivirga sp.]
MTSTFTRRGVLRSAGLAATAFGLAACSSGSTSGGKAGKPKVRLSVGVDPSYAPIYLAQRDGMFEDAGVSVEFVQVEGGAAGVQNVSAGTTQLSVNADATVLPVAAKSDKIAAIASFEHSDTYFKVVLRKGVKPATIRSMVYFPGLGQYMTGKYMRSIGRQASDIKMVQAAPPDFDAILSRGDADGCVIFDPWVSRAVKQGGRVVAESKDFHAGYSQWIIADAAWLKGNEKTAGIVVDVLGKAAARVRKEPALGVRATAAQVDVPKKTAESAVSDIEFDVRGFSDADFRATRDLLQFLKSIKAVDGDVELATIMNRDWYSQHAGKATAAGA